MGSEVSKGKVQEDEDFLSSDEDPEEEAETVSDLEESGSDEDDYDRREMEESSEDEGGIGGLLPACQSSDSTSASSSFCAGHDASSDLHWLGKLGNTAHDREEAVTALIMRNLRDTVGGVFNKVKEGKQNSGTRPAHIQLAHDHVASAIFSDEITKHGLTGAATRLTGFSRTAINTAIGKRKSSDLRDSEFQPRRRAKRYSATDEEFLYEIIHEVQPISPFILFRLTCSMTMGLPVHRSAYVLTRLHRPSRPLPPGACVCVHACVVCVRVGVGGPSVW